MKNGIKYCIELLKITLGDIPPAKADQIVQQVINVLEMLIEYGEPKR